MPEWILMLTLLLPGQPPETLAVGQLINVEACALAGAGMVQLLSETTPDAVFSWICAPAGEGV